MYIVQHCVNSETFPKCTFSPLQQTLGSPISRDLGANNNVKHTISRTEQCNKIDINWFSLPRQTTLDPMVHVGTSSSGQGSDNDIYIPNAIYRKSTLNYARHTLTKNNQFDGCWFNVQQYWHSFEYACNYCTAKSLYSKCSVLVERYLARRAINAMTRCIKIGQNAKWKIDARQHCDGAKERLRKVKSKVQQDQ